MACIASIIFFLGIWVPYKRIAVVPYGDYLKLLLLVLLFINTITLNIALWPVYSGYTPLLLGLFSISMLMSLSLLPSPSIQYM